MPGNIVIRSINRLLLQPGAGATALVSAENDVLSKNLTVNSTINCTTAVINGNGTITANCTAAKYYCAGETYSFIVHRNGTGASGWFISINQFWYTGHAYLKVAIYI